MSNIGLAIEPDNIVLTRGRDFKWSFENLDDDGAPEDYPAGDLFFELDTGGEHNALQSIVVSGASGGTYNLGVSGSMSGPIDFYDATSNPYGIDGDITDALEALPTVGAGNVFVHPARLYPVWEIAVELNAGKNEVQEVKINGNVSGGNFKLGFGGDVTAQIPFASTDAVVTSALQALPDIGAGNVLVTKLSNFQYRVEFIGSMAGGNHSQILGFSWGWGWGLTGDLFASVTTKTLVNGLAKLTEPIVNVLNDTVNNVFNSFEGMLGVDIDFVVNDALNARLKVTSRRAFRESDIITFNVNLTGEMLENAINNIADFLGLLETVTVDFYWNHHYQVEFVEDLGLMYVPAIAVDDSLLTGVVATPSVDVEVLDAGKERFTHWNFVIVGSSASLNVESEEADLIGNRAKWQLVFMPAGETGGGDPIALGTVRVQR